MRSRWPIWRRLCVPLPVRPKRRSSTLRSRGRRFSIRKLRASWRSELRAERGAFVVGHRLGELEIAVVVEDGVERHRSAGGGLQVGQVFEAAAGAGGEFLRAGQMLAAVGQGFGFLLQQTELLQMVRRQADQMALAGDRDLQRLPNPPGGVGRQAGAVADVEAVDGLHQAADRLLQEIGVAQGVMAESLGDVGGQADVGRGQAMLAVDVAIVNAADVDVAADVVVAVIANELSHRPRFERRPMRRAGAENGGSATGPARSCIPRTARATRVLLRESGDRRKKSSSTDWWN